MAEPPADPFQAWLATAGSDPRLEPAQVSPWLDHLTEAVRRLEAESPTGLWTWDLVNLAFSLLELEPLTDGRGYSTPATVLAWPRDLSALTATERAALAGRALDILAVWLKRAERGSVFGLWNVLLPASARSPYRLSVLELLVGRWVAVGVVQGVLQVVQAWVERAGDYLSHVGGVRGGSRTTTSTSFTPIYQNLTDSLAQTLDIFDQFILATHVDIALRSQATKVLGGLLRCLPLARLDPTPVARLRDTAHRLIDTPNSVSQICGLNLLLQLTLPTGSDRVEAAIGLFGQLALERTPETADRNIRYVCLQNLGHLAASPTRNRIVAKILERESPGGIVGLLHHADASVVLHVLRFLKLLAKHDTTHTPAHKAVWSGLLRTPLVGHIQHQWEPSLLSGFCDCLAEIPEPIFDALPADKQAVLVSFVLSHCRSPESSVSSSCFRCLGVLAAFRYAQSDISFLLDCTHTILEALDQGRQASASLKNPVINITWAMANLSDTLGEIPLREVGYPWPSLFRLLGQIPALMATGQQTHVNTRVNCLRALGCLLRSVQMSELDELDKPLGLEMLEIGSKSVDSLIVAIHTSAIMKVKWNGCYALGHALRNSELLRRLGRMTRVIETMRLLLEECRNFKVLNTLCQSLCFVEHRSDLGQEANVIFGLLCHVLEFALPHDLNDDESMHKINLTNSICLAMGHLFLLSNQSQLLEWNKSFGDDQWDLITNSMDMVRKRLSPEKANSLEASRTHVQGLLPGSRLCASLSS